MHCKAGCWNEEPSPLDLLAKYPQGTGVSSRWFKLLGRGWGGTVSPDFVCCWTVSGLGDRGQWLQNRGRAECGGGVGSARAAGERRRLLSSLFFTSVFSCYFLGGGVLLRPGNAIGQMAFHHDSSRSRNIPAESPFPKSRIIYVYSFSNCPF